MLDRAREVLEKKRLNLPEEETILFMEERSWLSLLARRSSVLDLYRYHRQSFQRRECSRLFGSYSDSGGLLFHRRFQRSDEILPNQLPRPRSSKTCFQTHTPLVGDALPKCREIFWVQIFWVPGTWRLKAHTGCEARDARCHRGANSPSVRGNRKDPSREITNCSRYSYLFIVVVHWQNRVLLLVDADPPTYGMDLGLLKEVRE